MALIVEDGSIVAGAESYASVLTATAYLNARGKSTWADLDQDVKEAKLRIATDTMTQLYRNRWYGTRVSLIQSLDWPRYNVQRPDAIGYARGYLAVYPYNVVPAEIANACIELAYRASTGLDLNPDTTASIKEEKIGPLTTVYERGSIGVTKFRAVDNMLFPFISGANFARVVRA